MNDADELKSYRNLGLAVITSLIHSHVDSVNAASANVRAATYKLLNAQPQEVHVEDGKHDEEVVSKGPDVEPAAVALSEHVAASTPAPEVAVENVKSAG